MRHRKRFVRFAAAGLLAAGAVVLAGQGPVLGQDDRVVRATAIVKGRAGLDAKVPALRMLADLDSSDARAALEKAAESRDGRLAGRALLEIGRSGYDGADDVLRRTYEDPKRPHAARIGALLAYARLRQRAGASWEDIEAYASRHAEPGSRLATSLADMKNGLRRAPRERK